MPPLLTHSQQKENTQKRNQAGKLRFVNVVGTRVTVGNHKKENGFDAFFVGPLRSEFDLEISIC